MEATMMHTPMTVQMIMQHGARVFPESRVGTFDGRAVSHKRYADIAADATRLAAGLHALGIRPGDRVGTFSWNNTAHMEAYLAVPAMGAIMHTVNIRLSPEHIAYVINHAGDRAVIVDASLLPLFEPVVPLLDSVEHLVVFGGEAAFPRLNCVGYGALLEGQDPAYDWPELDETAAAAVCYTSGTTGNPKGVVYSHRTTFVHSLASRATDTFGISEHDRILLLPSMFHANAWGMPYSGWFSGSDFIMPGPHLQVEGIARMVTSERPTITAMVPRLEHSRMVRRDRDTKDRRVVKVSLTRSGQRELTRLISIREKEMERIFSLQLGILYSMPGNSPFSINSPC